MTYKIYGIKNCNTMKKAFSWLEKYQIAYEFHDYKKEGISEGKLKKWCAQMGWELLLNRKGMTWRNLSDNEKRSVTDEKSAVSLMQNKTSIIKRPVIEKEEKIVVVGFSEEEYKTVFLS